MTTSVTDSAGAMVTELVMAFGIVAVCALIHAFSMVLLADYLFTWRAAFERDKRMRKFTLLIIVAFAIIILLHMIEAAIWAVFYYSSRLFDDFETALYFSLGSYTTIGYGDVVLPQRWRLLGGIEGISGVLLCGLSTAFIFAIVNSILQIRFARRTDRT